MNEIKKYTLIGGTRDEVEFERDLEVTQDELESLTKILRDLGDLIDMWFGLVPISEGKTLSVVVDDENFKVKVPFENVTQVRSLRRKFNREKGVASVAIKHGVRVDYADGSVNEWWFNKPYKAHDMLGTLQEYQILEQEGRIKWKSTKN